jgi:hypothetical protein
MTLIGTLDAARLPPDARASRQSVVARADPETVPSLYFRPRPAGNFQTLAANDAVQPQSTVTFAVVSGDSNNPAPSYQWQLGGTKVSESAGGYAMITDGAPEGASGQAVPATTLAYHLATNALGRAHGRAGGYADELELSHWTYAVYSGTNMACLTNSIWSTNCWLHGVQGLSATCIGFSNGMGGQGLMTMISPRHYLCSTHMHPEGFLTAFLDTNNVIYWRKTVQRVDLALDTSVGILNADLPPSVGFLPVATTNLLARLPADASSIVQGIGMNQQMAVFSQPMNFGNPLYIQWDSRFAAPHGPGTNWNTALGGGDSSSPVTLLIGNQLVLVSHAYGANVGPNYAPQFTAINERMRYLSNNNHAPVYQLTPAVP